MNKAFMENYIIEKEAIGDEPWKWESDYEVLPSNENCGVIRLVKVLGNEQYSASELTEKIGLKDRVELFKSFYLTPAIQAGLVRRLASESPHHPRQKYLLTAKGLEFYNKMSQV